MVLNDRRIAGVIRSDFRIVMRSDLPLAAGVDDVGILRVHLPVPAPLRTARSSKARWRLEPWHVMHVNGLQIGLGHRHRLAPDWRNQQQCGSDGRNMFRRHSLHERYLLSIARRTKFSE